MPHRYHPRAPEQVPKLCQACTLDFRVLGPDPMFTLLGSKVLVPIKHRTLLFSGKAGLQPESQEGREETP